MELHYRYCWIVLSHEWKIIVTFRQNFMWQFESVLIRRLKNSKGSVISNVELFYFNQRSEIVICWTTSSIIMDNNMIKVFLVPGLSPSKLQVNLASHFICFNLPVFHFYMFSDIAVFLCWAFVRMYRNRGCLFTVDI